MKQLITLLGSLVFSSVPVSAVTLEELLQSAKEKDLSLYALKKNDEIRVSQYEMEDIIQGPTFSTSLQMTRNDSQSLSGEVGASQPLNDILGWKGGEALKKMNRNMEMFKYRWEYYQAEKKLEQEVVSLLKDILAKEKDLLDHESKIIKKQLEWDTATKFGTLGSGTAAELSLRMDLNKLHREKLRIELDLEETRFKLVSRTGHSAAVLPELPPFELPSLPDSESVSTTPAVLIERWRLEIKEEELRQRGGDPPPKLSLSGSLQVSEEGNAGELLTSVSSKAGIALEKKIGGFLDVKGSISYGTGGITLSTGLTWDPFNGKKEELERRIKELETAKQNLMLQKSLSSYREEEQGLKNRVTNLKIRYESVLEGLVVAEQTVKELSFAWERGFITENQKRDGILALESLRYEKFLLVLEARNLQLEIDQYFYTTKQEGNE